MSERNGYGVTKLTRLSYREKSIPSINTIATLL
jgi:hypothetical protein